MRTPIRLLPAIRALRSGDIIAYPTEAVFGLGCNPLDATAVERLRRLKARAWRKGLILIAASQRQLAPYLQPIPAHWQQCLDATWPGPVTWLLPCRPSVPRWLTGGRDTIAVRVTDHPLARAVCLAWGGALVSTSANRSGAPAARTAFQARLRLGAPVAVVVHGCTGGRSRPSEIRDLRSGRTLRRGDTSAETITPRGTP
jgi:L-threonylcarbamoyladenylate synthase